LRKKWSFGRYALPILGGVTTIPDRSRGREVVEVSYRSVATAVSLSVACALVAGGCWWRAERLSAQAAWLLLRGNAEAAEYTSTFDGRHVDQELTTFQERRAVLERALWWQHGATALELASVLFLVGSYGLYLLLRLQQQELGARMASPVGVRIR
jgi:hypothetical protein